MKYTIYTFLLALFLSACYRDSENIIDETIVETPEVVVEEAKIVGQIMSEYGSLSNDVNISFDGKTNTDGLPYFYFEADNIKKYNELLTFQHSSGMELSIPLVNIENTVNYHDIFIPSSFETHKYDRDQNLTIEVKAGLDVEILAGSIPKDGGIYDNNTPILVKHLDPNRVQELRLIPGFLVESNLYNNGYLKIEDAFILGFLGSSLQDLRFQADKISVNTEESLFYFDDSIAMWTEIDDEFDFRVGYYAIGTVKNSNFIELNINSNKNIEGLSVSHKLTQYDKIEKRITANNKVIIHAPVDLTVQTELINQNKVIKTESISTNDTNIPMDLSLADDQLKKIQVDLRNCTDDKENQGILSMNFGSGNMVHFIESDEPIYILDDSSEKIGFFMYSDDFMSKTNELSIDFQENTKLGRQYFCDEVEEDYLVFNIEGFHKILTKISYVIIDDLTTITGQDDNGASLSIRFEHAGTGLVEDIKSNILLNDEMLGDGYRLNCFTTNSGCGFEEFEITNYGNTEDTFVKGKFKGTFWIESIDQENAGYRFLNGEFQFKR